MAKKQLSEKLVLMDLIDEPGVVVRLEIDSEEIMKLSESIRALGLMQAILVRTVKDRFEIIYGHRRFLACRLLGYNKIRATVRELDDVTAAMMRATENTDRVDISPIEEAVTYKGLCETHNLTIDQVSKMMGKSASIIKRRMDLLRMPDCLQKAIHHKQISYTVGEVLWSLGDQTEIQYYLGFAVDNGASRATVNQWVKEALDNRRRAESPSEGGRGWSSPMESTPIYVACDLCKDPMEIGKESVIRACPSCANSIKKAMET